MTPSNSFSALRLVGRTVRRVVDHQEHKIIVAGVDEAVFDMSGDLHESPWLGVPGLLAELYAGGAAQEVERVVVVVVMQRRCATDAELGYLRTEQR